MQKVNTNKLPWEPWSSPKGKFVGAGKAVSEALGRKPLSTDLNERHPFDVEILRIPPGKTPYPYHLHSAQWDRHLPGAFATLRKRARGSESREAVAGLRVNENSSPRHFVKTKYPLSQHEYLDSFVR